ncbi:MAG TPA: glycine cleavage system aminomethyltransferase GcvT [Acidimicrobiales bacterium]|nr:glycine cleavage system aminomethyltransferase GcvT [Acidimicrobiales bacterium]
MSLRQTTLRAEHEELGAKLVEFGGWEMPLSYPGGTLAEHLACRSDAVVFDVSHLGTVRVEGPDAFAHLQESFTNDLAKVAPGRAQYTHLLAEVDASVLDDLIVWWVAPDRFDVMPNASNTAGVREAVGGEDVTDERVVLAVQGPVARVRLSTVSPDAAAVPRFGVAPFEFAGAPCIAAGTGYTGEDGVECAVPAEAAVAFWRALLAAGVEPAGLGARDTLRLEAGLPLHSHELGPGITPLQANLGWVVAWEKGDFRGRSALAAEREAGVKRLLRGVVTPGRRPPRAGDACYLVGKRAGLVTSGNFSPVLGRGIGLAFLPPNVRDGVSVVIDVRGSDVAARVVRPPFHRLDPAALPTPEDEDGGEEA